MFEFKDLTISREVRVSAFIKLTHGRVALLYARQRVNSCEAAHWLPIRIPPPIEFPHAACSANALLTHLTEL